MNYDNIYCSQCGGEFAHSNNGYSYSQCDEHNGKRHAHGAVVLQATPAYELRVSIDSGKYGHTLAFASFLPLVKQPEERVQFKATLSTEDLSALGNLIKGATS